MILVTPLQLKSVFKTCRNPGVWARAINMGLAEWDLNTSQRLAGFLAQCGYESEDFNVLRELMSYSTPAKLRAVYPREFPTDDAAQRYVMNPQGLANFVYANRNGNGDVTSNDGFVYRGGGLIQLTGRGNYREVGKALGLDLELRPKQIAQEPIAMRTAGFFWKQNDLNAAMDEGDFDYTTRKVNGSAMEGAAERRALYHAMLAAIGSATPEQAAADARRSSTVTPADGVMTPGYRGA